MMGGGGVLILMVVMITELDKVSDDCSDDQNLFLASDHVFFRSEEAIGDLIPFKT